MFASSRPVSAVIVSSGSVMTCRTHVSNQVSGWAVSGEHPAVAGAISPRSWRSHLACSTATRSASSGHDRRSHTIFL